MSNFSPKVEDATEKELLHFVGESDPRVASLASDELTRRTIKQFESTIKEEVKSNNKFSKAFIAFGVVQIAIALFQFIFDVTGDGKWTTRSTTGIFVLLFIGWMFWYMLKDIKKDNIN